MSSQTGVSSNIGSTLHEINVFLFEKNKKATSIIGGILIVCLTYMVFWMEADSVESLGKADINAIIRGGGNGDGPDLEIIRGYELMVETVGDSDTLQEQDSTTIPITATEEKVVSQINVSLTWNDEPDGRIGIRYWENQGDTFQVEVLDPEGEVLKTSSGTNGRNSQGSVDLSIPLNDTQITDFYGAGGLEVRITLVDAGDYEARVGIGFLIRTDPENAYDAQIEVSYYAPPAEE